MDNVAKISQDDLNRYMGCVEAGTANSTKGTDASGSKQMIVNTDGSITYNYRRGGVTVSAKIDVPTQATTWSVYGVTGNATRLQAIKEGLKLANDPTDATTDPWVN